MLRKEILASATALIDAGGDERAVTLRAVARHAGIAAPSIYPHFPDHSALMLAVVRDCFAELASRLRSSAEDPCAAYLDFARDHPQRYRVMFDGAWKPIGISTEVLVSLGEEPLGVLVGMLRERGNDEPELDAVALWLGLHGLAHQRAVCRPFPWPADITQRIAVLASGRTQP
ncbi:TetR/AcrR family transcriptional regulator [Allokutzneria sp. NRRL B-24872]|uniref:TetR/AcrR family transcriptional regulator n=1 Tax=Allokutzneria sp. NRRL B-24872 TaxID=1137961 RepID=UPI001AF003CF|nr:TetR/AcrR family transcriptional regulator [Allokutzneria sp. NRRL B-24872]